MGFSNKKEDVIYMELTPYGRQLLSRGQLKPAYYSFFDDDVMYNIATVPTVDTSNYPSGFLSESNGDSKQRILTETPYLKPQNSYIGRDTKIRKIQNYYLYKDLYKHENNEKTSFLNYPLGTSNYHSRDSAPYWNIKYLHGTASSTEISPGVFSLNTKKYLDSGSSLPFDSNGQPIRSKWDFSLPYKSIPQVHFNVDYEMSIKNVYTDEDIDAIEFISPNLQVSSIAEDGTYVSMKESPFMLHVIEENAFTNGDAFIVEVYKKDKFKNDAYVPLKFMRSQYGIANEIVIDDLLVQVSDEDIYDDAEPPSPEYVEYYFDLKVDSEIPEEDICNGLQFLKRKEIFIDLDVDCIERDDDGIQDIDIYATRVTEIEEC